MTFFNDLSSGRAVYPSLCITFEDGTTRLIKDVSFYTAYETSEGEKLRAFTRGDEGNPIELHNIKMVYNTFYDYKG